MENKITVGNVKLVRGILNRCLGDRYATFSMAEEICEVLAKASQIEDKAKVTDENMNKWWKELQTVMAENVHLSDVRHAIMGSPNIGSKFRGLVCKELEDLPRLTFKDPPTPPVNDMAEELPSEIISTVAEFERNGGKLLCQVSHCPKGYGVKQCPKDSCPYLPITIHPVKAPADDGLVEALEKLSRLGNGDEYGNSDGNRIAQEALARYKASDKGVK